MKKHSRPTVADLLSMKGKRQLTMLRVTTLEEAEAAEKAKIDMPFLARMKASRK